MRSLVLFAAFTLVIGLLAACVTTEDSDDDPADDTTAEQPTEPPEPAETPEPTETPEPDDAADDATDDVTDDSTDDAVADDTPDDAAVDDAADDAMDDEATDDATDDATDEATEHVVEMQDPDSFEPDELEIAAGDTVTFVNAGNIPHTSTLDPEQARDEENAILPEGAETWDSGNLEPGDEFSITLEVPGEYVYICIPHEALGMVGTIIVEEP